MLKWWPIKLMFLCIIIILIYHPNEDIYQYLSISNLMFSVPFLTCISLTIVGILLIRIHKVQEITVALWHLTNATWWSFGCDILSGLFAIMPNLSNIYKIMDTNHLSIDKRHTLDAIYWCELFIHVPLSWICFYSYLVDSGKKYILETFLAGIQLMGTIAYYLPEILNNCHSWKYNILASSLNLVFGLIWIIYPCIILKKNLTNVINNQKKQHDK